MVYKYDRRVRLKTRRIRIISLGLLGCLIIFSILTTYTNTRGISLLKPGQSGIFYPAKSGGNLSLGPAKTSHPVGSAHQAATGQATPSVSPISPSSLQATDCSLFPPQTPGLANAISPELQKLAQYESVCNGTLAARVSFFVSTPTTTSEALSEADNVATTLKEFASFNVTPLVFIEPVDNNGNNLDLNAYSNGTYDSALDAYFAALKNNGVTDAMMGMWVVLPEGNLPVWSTTNPVIYATDVTKTIQFQKKYFPESQSAILLDSESYAPDASWGDGSYVSFLPYIQNIPKGLIDSFGLQGFPWVAPANQTSNAVYDPKIYLRVDFAAEAARALGITNIWFNTGTFNQMYTQSADETVTLTPTLRQTKLNGVIAQANILQSQGFSVAIHLFAQDKSNTSEATDWSYWKVQPANDANTDVFKAFVYDATKAGIPLWLFDSE